MRHRASHLVALGIWVTIVGCSTPDDECEVIDTDCMPQYEPTFDNIHSRTLVSGCATGGGSCHATPDSSGGFSLTDVETSYEELSSRAGSDTCGLLVARITSDNPSFQMPPGAPLSSGEQCAILQWVEAGTPR